MTPSSITHHHPSNAPRPNSAQEALNLLLDGNNRFVSEQFEHPRQDSIRRSEVVAGQAPFAIVITCSDSRVPPEIIFDLGIGDIFVVRTAGNVLDDIGIGSVEYAVEHLNVPLVVVMGHQKCGAVSAVASGAELTGHLKDVAWLIEPAVEKAHTLSGDLITNAIDANIGNVVELLKYSQPILAEFVHAGQLEVVGARYDLESGKVEILSGPVS